MGAILPPHLSPFTEGQQDQIYIPPEERALIDPDFKLNDGKISTYLINRYTKDIHNLNIYYIEFMFGFF